MKQIAMAFAALGIAVSTGLATPAGWLTDYNAAIDKAKADGKAVLLDFTGSDWCGWCMKLKAEVFDKPEFAKFATDNLVLVEVDFPRKTALAAAQQQANSALAKRYNVQGYPTLMIVNPSGQTLGEMGYMPGGPSAFLNQLTQIRGFDWKKSGSAPDNPNQTPDPAAPSVAEKSEPLWGGLNTPPKQYTSLKLTGLAGSENRKFAIVNNQTFAAGETARVKLNNGEVKVLCKEIREKSVLIQVQGSAETSELFLGK